LSNFVEKIIVILPIIENALTIIATAVDMVNLSGFEFHTGEVF